MSNLLYRFPNGTRIVLNEDHINSHNAIVQAYRGSKAITLPLWVEEGIVKALSYTSIGELCIRWFGLPKEIRTTIPTKIYTTTGKRVVAKVGGL